MSFIDLAGNIIYHNNLGSERAADVTDQNK